MNPQPFSSLNHLTRPTAIGRTLHCETLLRAAHLLQRRTLGIATMEVNKDQRTGRERDPLVPAAQRHTGFGASGRYSLRPSSASPTTAECCSRGALRTPPPPPGWAAPPPPPPRT